MDDAACYAALRSHDARFDGRFFCGVSSTGIYCRPICRVKLPKSENCTFFPSAAAAEAAGYRPCLKCRPELAPGLAPADAGNRAAGSAARLIDEDGLADGTIADLAAMLRISDRHLRRVFFAEYGVTPVQYLQTRRLLLAKSLLADTSLSVTDVAMTAGFGSIRRFNDIFQKRYRLAPSRFRDGNYPQKKGVADDAITLFLCYRPPYAWEEILSFLGARAVVGIESVVSDAYRRAVVLVDADGTAHCGWISVTNAPKRHALAVTMSSALLPVLPKVLARVRHLFDVDCDPVAVQEKLATLRKVSPDLPVPGLRLPGSFDTFETCCRAILGQQVTVKAARTLASRVARSFGETVLTPFAEVNCTFPLPETICSFDPPVEDRLGPLGIIGARARSILAVARACIDDDLILSHTVDPETAMKKLRELPGFGAWTAQYVAMRVLGWPDVFLPTDFGVKKALSALPKEDALKLAESWSPWRSYATVSLWHALGKEEKLKAGKEKEK